MTGRQGKKIKKAFQLKEFSHLLFTKYLCTVVNYKRYEAKIFPELDCKKNMLYRITISTMPLTRPESILLHLKQVFLCRA